MGMPDDTHVPFSVLDLVPLPEGVSSAEALRRSLDLARHAEGWGYGRYWVAEHHNIPGVASSAPAVLIGHLAAATSHMRIGSGGVMLPNHAPLVVAEQFSTLAGFHPGRIDLGLGRAPGTDQRTAMALRRSPGGLSADDFPAALAELLGYLSGDQGSHVRCVPPPEGPIPVWLLGSSGYSAELAGLLGMPFAFAHHFSPANTLPALELYRSSFRPSPSLTRPYAMVCATVVAAADDESARRIHAPSALSFLWLRQGRPRRMPAPDEAAAYPYSGDEAAALASFTAEHIVGGPETVRRGIEDLLERTQADELMVSTMTYGHEERLRSYEIVAGVLRQLGSPAATSTVAGA